MYTIRQQLPLHIYTLYFLNHRVTCIDTKARVILQSFHFIFHFFCVLKLRERKINKFEEILSSGRAVPVSRCSSFTRASGPIIYKKRKDIYPLIKFSSKISYNYIRNQVQKKKGGEEYTYTPLVRNLDTLERRLLYKMAIKN